MAETYTDTNIIRVENFASLEAALDFAIAEGGNRTVMLKPGHTYTLTGAFTINQDGITIEGNGATMNFTGSGSDVFVVSSGVEDFSIRNLTCAITGGGAAIYFVDQAGGSRTILENVHVTDTGLYRTSIDGSNRHKQLTIRRCSCSGDTNSDGINLQGTDGALIEQTIIGSDGDAIGSDGIKLNIDNLDTTIRGCIISNCSDDAIDMYGGGRGILIEKCLIYDKPIELKSRGNSPRPEVLGAVVRGCEFRDGGKINMEGLFVPFRFYEDTITGDGSTGPYTVTHTLDEVDPFLEVRVFNGATELTGGGTDFSFTTPDRDTVAITMASALGGGVERQVIIAYKVTQVNNYHEETVSSGASSYAINHALGTQYSIDVAAWDNTDQSRTAISSITYTDEDNCTVVFSGSLSNDHRILVRVYMLGTERITIEDNYFYLSPGGVPNAIITNGAVEYDIRNNRVIQPDRTTALNTAAFSLRPPARVGRVADNTFFDVQSGNSFYVINIADTSDAALGINDPQARLIIEHNTSANHDERFIQSGPTRIHMEVRGNQSRDFGGSANNQYAIGVPAEGYTLIMERNYNVVDGAIAQVFDAPVSAVGDGDTTPNVQGRNVWATANTGATTYTDFDGFVEDGYRLTLVIGDGNSTFDFSGTSLKGNAAADLTPASGDVLHFVHYGGNWYLVGHVDIA